MRKLPKLPTNIQAFARIRNEKYLYVDKTKYLIDLIDTGDGYFLSRPRRFGKSLTISTFDALFSGKRELFKGLYAEEFCSRPEYRAYPVIRLDMSKIITHNGVEGLLDSMLLQVIDNAERNALTLSELSMKNPATAFDALISRTAQKEQRPVVLLIDEYDKPILDNLNNMKEMQKIREILRDFYVQIKAAGADVHFTFVTGISKFSKMGLFSALNNLMDISMNDEYATMLGYTEDEFTSGFSEYIDATAERLEVERETLISDIRHYYDGFSFDGKTRVYNPFSTLNFFGNPVFHDYWFESGTPSALAEYVKKHDLSVDTFRGLEVARNFTSETEIESATPESFLYQSGYLSIREKQGEKLILDYPNLEVLSAVSKLFMSEKLGLPHVGVRTIDAKIALSRGRTEDFVEIYNTMLTSMPYDIYSREEKRYADKSQESFYHAMLLSMLWGAQINVIPEKHSSKGRSDLEISVNGLYYLVELKAAVGKEACEKAAKEAMKQILEKGYASPYEMSGVTLIAIAVDRKERRVGAHEIREFGRSGGDIFTAQ